MTVIASAVGSTPGLNVRVEVEVQQGVHLGRDLEDDVSAVSAITAVRSAEGYELLAVDGGTAVASVAGLQVQDHTVNELRHGRIPFLMLRVLSKDKATTKLRVLNEFIAHS